MRSLEEANRENRRIIAGLVQRVPELEAARQEERQEGHQEPAGGQDRAPGGQRTTGQDSLGPEEGIQRPWWRRVFGG